MALTSSRGIVPSPLLLLRDLLSANNDGCSISPGPTRAFVESALLVRAPLVEAEHVVSLLSVDEGDVIMFGRDLERLCRPALASLRALLVGTFDGLGLATLEFKELPLRTDLIVLRDAGPAPGEG